MQKNYILKQKNHHRQNFALIQILTMFDSRNNLHKQVAGEIRKHFSDKVFKSVIPRNVKLSECPSFGKPIILYDIESRGSEAYLSLAKEMILKTKTISKEKKAETGKRKKIPKRIKSEAQSELVK